MRLQPRFWKTAYRVRRSLWARPLAIISVAMVLGLLLPALERSTGWVPPTPIRSDASPSAVRELLLAGIGGLATILAVGFSMTMLMVQLASSQYTPRLLRVFMADRMTQWVLGTYVAAIIFLVLVLGATTSGVDGQDGFVPHVSVRVATALALGCLILLAFFLHHTTRSVDAAAILARLGKQTLSALKHLPHTHASEHRLAVDLSGAQQVQVPSIGTGYIQLIDERLLLAALQGHTIEARLEVRTGDFVMPGVPLISFSAAGVSPALRKRIHNAFAIGSERTLDDDVLYGVRRLVDVALRALSPAINDVTTAVMAVNELGVITHAVAMTGQLGMGWRAHREKNVTLWVRAFGLEDHLSEAYSELPRSAREHPRVIGRILETLAHVGRMTSDPKLVELIARCAREVLEAVNGNELAERERKLITERWAALESALLHRPPKSTEPEPLH